jgi:SulP family sulfate permease
MGVPTMAYALIAGLPPAYGLYTAIIPCAVAAILGSSKHLITGPTNTVCLLIFGLTAHIPPLYDVPLLQVILYLTFLTGLFQLAFGLFRLGGLVRYVSTSVVIGFTAGAGILIAVGELENILGVDISDAGAERSFEVLYATLVRIPETHFPTLGIAVVTAAIAVGAPKLDRRLPGALLGILVTSGASFLLGWHRPESAFHVRVVRDLEPIPAGVPGFSVPELLRVFDYELTRELGIGALALAVFGCIEASSIARTLAASSGQRLNYNREFVGQGAAKLAGSFFHCFASSGSFTRSAVCLKSGGRTRAAGVFSAGWMALALLALGPVANYIPTAALSGVLVVIAWSMVDKRRLRHSWSSGGGSRMVLGGTLAATILLPLEYALFIGISISIVLLLRATGRIDLTQLIPREGQGFDEVPFNRAAPSPVVTVNMEGDLYFAAAEDLDHELVKCITPQTRVIVLRMKRLRAVGSTAMAMLEHFWRLLRERGITLVVCGIEDELKKVMTGSGLRKQIGEQNIFYADNRLFRSTELALARAARIVEHERRATAEGEGAAAGHRPRIVARDLLNPRCLRFGNQHQVREAAWLMSELHKGQRVAAPEPLFLQDREGRLAGELTPWRLLATLVEEVDLAASADLDDHRIGELLRQNLNRTIDTVARTDPEILDPDTPLARLLEVSVARGAQVLPITDDAARIQGLVSATALLRGLELALARRAAEPKEAPDAR